MGCANAKAAGIPSSGKTDYPLEVTDGSDGTNFINNQVPKVVINGGDVLDNGHHVNGGAEDAEDKANGNAGNRVPDASRSPPKDDKDDREAVADRAAETPVENGNDVSDDGGDNGADDNGADDNGNRLPQNDVATDEPMPDAGNRTIPDVVSDAPNGNNDSPRDLNEDNDIAPNDIFVDDGLDYDSKKADRQSNVGHDLIVQDA
ncbi:hypothetical protein MTO96_024237 [Rhipicephalus appendiculatus]